MDCGNTCKPNTVKEESMKSLKTVGIIIFALSLAAGAASLGELAAGMSAREWLDITPDTSFGSTYIRCPGGGHILQYAEGAAWDPIHKKVLFVGHAHYSCWRFISYDAATSQWKNEPLAGWMSGLGHAYDHNTVNPANGDFFHHKNYTKAVHKYNVSTKSWSKIPDIPDNLTGYWACCNGLAYFPEMKGLIMANNGEIFYYNETLNRWSRSATGLAMGDLNNVAEYNPIHKCVLLGGGNGGGTSLHKLDQTGKIHSVKTPPTSVGVTVSVLTVDPVGGKYLLFGSNGTLYEYDPVGNNWSTVSTGNKEALFVHNRGDGASAAIAVPIPEYGIIMVITWDFWRSKVLLYKHSKGTTVAYRQAVPYNQLKMTIQPNPFNGVTRFTIPGTEWTSLRIYDTAGRMVKDLSHELYRGTAEFNADSFAPGLYIARLSSGKNRVERKLMLVR